jgi:hypothetical protein
MKKFSKFLLIIFLIAGFFTTSCNKDNGNTPALTRNSLTGKWLVNESKKKATYEVTFLIDSTTTNGVLINNFAGSGPTVNAVAYLSGTTLSLKSNELLSNGWIVNGSGTVSGSNLITWPYSLHDGANLINVQATFTKE